MDDFGPIERTLTQINSVFAFTRIPPRTSAAGYIAKSWGEEHQWEGKLRIKQKGAEATIELIDRDTGALFAQCVYNADIPNAVEAVQDSSRYFVLRLVDQASGRTAFIGIAFQERASAFDFNVALGDFRKEISREKEPVVDQGPTKDWSLQQGQKISLSVPIQKSTKLQAKKNKTGGGLLAPPPAAGGRRKPGMLAPPPSGNVRRQTPAASNATYNAQTSSIMQNFAAPTKTATAQDPFAATPSLVAAVPAQSISNAFSDNNIFGQSGF